MKRLWQTTLGEWPACVLRTGLGVLLVTACSTLPKVAGLEHDPGFDHSSLTSGGIAVAGFASSVDTLAAVDSQHTLATLLEAEIPLERPDVAVLSAAAVVESLGGEAYSDLMEEFARSGEIDSATLKSISRMLPDVRYAVFARLEEDVISESESSGPENDCEDLVEMSTEREVTIGLKVYDLSAGIPVWRGWISHSEEESDEHCGINLGSSFWELLAGALVDSVIYEHPPAPELAEVSGKIFEAFAKELP
jgi:hypothetical protein